MILRKGFRYRIYPTTEQVAKLVAWQSALRFLWNLALEQRLLGLARPKKRYYTAFDQAKELTAVRAEAPWLADVPRNVSVQMLVVLDEAWRRCFKRLAGRPHWKRRGRDTVNLCEPHPKIWRLAGSTLHFPKLGPMRAVVHRPLEGRAKTCTIVQDGDQWFASIVCEIEMTPPTPRTTPVVGIDRGLAAVVADSDGNLVSNPRHLERTARRLAHAQRVVSRRKKGSRNRDKAKIRVMRLHRTVRRQRDHFLHVLAAAYAKSHGTVVVEDLQIRNMARNHNLARAILDAGWGKFVGMLKYKQDWSGGRLVAVPAAYSSQTCSWCGHVDARSRRSQSLFACTACGIACHADTNASIVIKQRFFAVEHTVTACGGFPDVAGPAKQEQLVVTRATRHRRSGASQSPGLQAGD